VLHRFEAAPVMTVQRFIGGMHGEAARRADGAG
jgi:hypothetical protein